LPAVEIASSAIKCGARAIALSLVYPTDDHHLPAELASLRQFLPPGIAILAGGRATPAYHAALRNVGARFAGSLDDLYRILDELRELQPSTHTV
jgi:DNA-binding FadR family transcriptional regulator